MYVNDPSEIKNKTPSVPRTVVIGAGAAGLYAASQLAARGHEVVLIEAGGSQLGNFAPATYKNVGRNHSGIRLARSRNIGGTTNLWGGQLVEFQPIDLEGRKWLDHSSWPVSYDEIAPHFEAAYVNLGIPRKLIRDHDVWNEVGLKLPDLGPQLEMFLTRWMGIPNFAELFAKQLQSSPNIQTLLNHAVTGFRGSEGRIEAVRVVNGERKEFWIEGDVFFLAAGVIENARILLASAHDPEYNAPWKDNPNVGAYFQDHLGGRLGSFHPTDKKTFFQIFSNIAHSGRKFQPKIRMRNDVLSTERIYNTQGYFAFESEISEHLVFFKQFMRAALYSGKLNGIGDLFRKAGGIARFLVPLMWKYVWEHRIFVPSSSKTFLLMQSEHGPRFESRIAIDPSTVDASGLPAVVLNWQLSGDELSSFRDFALKVKQGLQDAGLGELKIDENLLALKSEYMDTLGDTYHQAGGTVMADSPESGVVDKNLKVFGTENLYIGGAGTFPSTSNANVTFTAIVFAERWVNFQTNATNPHAKAMANEAL